MRFSLCAAPESGTNGCLTRKWFDLSQWVRSSEPEKLEDHVTGWVQINLLPCRNMRIRHSELVAHSQGSWKITSQGGFKSIYCPAESGWIRRSEFVAQNQRSWKTMSQDVFKSMYCPAWSSHSELVARETGRPRHRVGSNQSTALQEYADPSQ